ncbi:hypothetical protein [Streptomyces sp. NPDC058308]|uniref:hypothetical protein n=1 Tax=Streptomyces sp. NPDC058308 TaxID=3346440 RepID=UPI0036E3D1B0
MTKRNVLAATGIAAALLMGGLSGTAPAQAAEATDVPHIACKTWKSGSGTKANGNCRGTATANAYRTVATCLRGNGTGTFTKRSTWEVVGRPAYVTANCGAKVLTMEVEFKNNERPYPLCLVRKTSSKAASASCRNIRDRKVRARVTCKKGNHKWTVRGPWKKSANSVAKCGSGGKLKGYVELEISKRGV